MDGNNWIIHLAGLILHPVTFTFTVLKGVSWWFNNDEEVKSAVMAWSSLHTADFFDVGIQKRVEQYD